MGELILDECYKRYKYAELPYTVEVRGGFITENPGLTLNCPETSVDFTEDQCEDDFNY